MKNRDQNHCLHSVGFITFRLQPAPHGARQKSFQQQTKTPMNISRKSVYSGVTRTKDLDVTPEQLKRIEEGEHIQNVLSHLTDDEREFILSGLTPEEWDIMFKDEEE